MQISIIIQADLFPTDMETPNRGFMSMPQQFKKYKNDIFEAKINNLLK
jgi:hypothetical protein